MKFFEPNGATLTPGAQQWLGIVLMAISALGVALWVVNGQKTTWDLWNLIAIVPLIPFGAYFAWTGHKRKRLK